jgi:hypothetical protein
MIEFTKHKITRDLEPTIPERAHLEVREGEQGPSAPGTSLSASESSVQRSSPGRPPLFRR